MDGLILVDKPAGPTSHDLVAVARRAAGPSRVGHTGTLDPPATGLLVLLLGRATRLAPYVPHAPKSYTGSFRLGLTTTTDDLTGEILSRSDGWPREPERVRAAAQRLVGTSWQVPPAVSARRVAGQRLYRASRRGVTLAAPPARIDVERFAVEPTVDPDVWTFEAVVSSGTFVRGLVRDLGASFGCGAAVATLRRTRIGPFDVAAALDGRLLRDSGVMATRIVPLDELPLAGASVTVGDDEAAAFRHGRTLGGAGGEIADGIVAVRTLLGELLGMAVATSGSLAPRVVLARAETLDDTSGAVVSSDRSTT